MKAKTGRRNLLIRLAWANITFFGMFFAFAVFAGGVPPWLLELPWLAVPKAIGLLVWHSRYALVVDLAAGVALSLLRGGKKVIIVDEGHTPRHVYDLGQGVCLAFRGETFNEERLRRIRCRVLVDSGPLFRHLHCLGSSGSGKTVSILQNLAVQHIEKGGGLVVLDGKTDYDTVRLLALAAQRAGRIRQFHLFDLADEKISKTYNPLIHGSPSEIAEKILSTFDFSDIFYEQRQRMAMYAFVDAVVRVRDLTKKPFNFRDILWIMYYIPESLQYLKEQLKDIPEAKDAREQLTMLQLEPIKSLKEQIAGIRSLMHRYSYTIPDPVRVNSYSPDIDMERVIRNNEIVYFSLNSMTYQETAYCMARLVLQDIQAVAGKLQYERRDVTLPFLIFMDEAGEYLYENFETFLKQSRSAGFGCIIMHQAMGDLKKPRADFTSQVRSNTEIKVVLPINDPVTRDAMSEAFGKMIVKRSVEGKSFGHVFEQVDGVIPRTQERAMEDEDFVIRPEMIDALHAGEGYVRHKTELFKVKFNYHEGFLKRARRVSLPIVQRRWTEELGSGMNISVGLKQYLRKRGKTDVQFLDEMTEGQTPQPAPRDGSPATETHRSTARLHIHRRVDATEG